MICEQWDTVVVPFPFLEKPVTKRRPSLVISTNESNRENGHLILAMITSSVLNPWPSDCVIADFEGAGLNVPCRVRWKVFTLPNDLIVQRLGTMALPDRSSCSLHLGRMLGG